MSDRKLRIVNVVGARPNFMKMAPLCREFAKHASIESYLVHTGQHYDKAMSDLFFTQLGLPKPDRHLGIGSGGHGEQTGRIMIAFEEVMADLQPDLVVVVGDVNSTIACALVAVKLGIKVAHVEAGLRSRDRTMPEEINRILTDQLSDYLFTTERSALDNLLAEGIGAERVHFVGNVMIDTLLASRQQAANSDVLSSLGVAPGEYALVTLHRPSNVDDPDSLRGLVDMVASMSESLPVVFPVHPRTQAKMSEEGLDSKVGALADVHMCGPLGYLDFLHCTENAKVVVTDSGGIQEETTVLGVPCITCRENTERPITVSEGTNTLVGVDRELTLREVQKVLQGKAKRGSQPEYWDGNAAQRIAQILLRQPNVG
ncbi:MAG: UDP-N-acetylglucosamine 2-epimerase (non-hydrolyzing) [Gammaproteobacteria bacterium]|nr:UDP-N-acetylglucosamine 2-epimerase (non-hydrolyzing) [Gammaproteobacteria bacterium]